MFVRGKTDPAVVACFVLAHSICRVEGGGGLGCWNATSDVFQELPSSSNASSSGGKPVLLEMMGHETAEKTLKDATAGELLAGKWVTGAEDSVCEMKNTVTPDDVMVSRPSAHQNVNSRGSELTLTIASRRSAVAAQHERCFF